MVALLILPFLALVQLNQSIDLRITLGAAVTLSLVTFFVYRADKRKAEAGEWRTPESTLHTLEILGGWPGAFFAQRLLRHKISKASYQSMFWMIVAVHQYAAFDFLNSWRYSRRILAALMA